MFDRYVAAQTSPAGRRRKQVLVVVSVAVHVVLVLGLIVYSFVHVEEVAPPLLTVTFFSAAAPPPPPPPPPPPAGKKKQDKKPKTPVTQPVKVQPLVQPKEPEKPEEEEEADEGEEGGQEGGVKGGVKGGVVGGDPNGQLGSNGPVKPPEPPPPPKPKNVAHAPDPSEWNNRPDPHVPEAIKIQRKGTGESVFFAVMCIDMNGKVTDVKIKQGIPGADESITAVLMTWRAKPQPIPICFPLRLEYTFE